MPYTVLVFIKSVYCRNYIFIYSRFTWFGVIWYAAKNEEVCYHIEEVRSKFSDLYHLIFFIILQMERVCIKIEQFVNAQKYGIKKNVFSD